MQREGGLRGTGQPDSLRIARLHKQYDEHALQAQ